MDEGGVKIKDKYESVFKQCFDLRVRFLIAAWASDHFQVSEHTRWQLCAAACAEEGAAWEGGKRELWS